MIGVPSGFVPVLAMLKRLAQSGAGKGAPWSGGS